MLVYVADLVLSYMVYGPWKDPNGFNFPQTKTFEKVTQIPKLFAGTRINIGLLIALFGVAGMWIYMFRTYGGFQLQVGGLAPAAARYAGFSSRRALWPKSLTGVFQGLLLFTLLACDTLIAYRVVWKSSNVKSEAR